MLIEPENFYGVVYQTLESSTGRTYIGQTTKKGTAFKSYFGSGKHISRLIRKKGIGGFTKEVLAGAIDKEELNQLEIYFIEQRKPILNILRGGQIGEGNLGRKFSDSHKEKISKSLKEKIGRDGSWRTKPILDLASGRRWPSSLQASLELEIPISSIGKVCRQKTPYYRGFFFRYENGHDSFLNADSLKAYVESCLQLTKGHKKPVLCIETGEVYSSISEASERNGILVSSLTNALNGRVKTSGKRHWKFITGEEFSQKRGETV